MIELLIVFIAGHYLGDYGLQTEFQALTKGKSWLINLAHAATYTAIIVFGFGVFDLPLPLWVPALILVTHFWIDATKARWGLITDWQDQLLHFAVFGVIVIVYQFGNPNWGPVYFG